MKDLCVQDVWGKDFCAKGCVLKELCMKVLYVCVRVKRVDVLKSGVCV